MAPTKSITLSRLFLLLFFGVTCLTCFQEVVRPQPPLPVPSTKEEVLLVDQLENELQKWEEIIGQKPDYVEAYLQASLLSFKLKKETKGFRYLQLAAQLSPNHPQVKQLTQLINREKK